MTESTTVVTIRMPDRLLAAIRTAADNARRSVSSEIIVALESCEFKPPRLEEKQRTGRLRK